jgi:hypothetical protein
LVGFVPFSALQPWFYVDAAATFDAVEKWPNAPSRGHLAVFARRQDNDDLACFELSEGVVTGVVVIHGWTGNGYSIVARYSTFWEWLRAVVVDIREWCESGDPNN